MFSDRPALATDLSKPGVRITSYGAFDPNPTAQQTIIPRNFGIGPSFFQVNLRLSKTIKVLRRTEPANKNYRVTFSVQVQNLTNQTNLGPVIGNLSSPVFGQSTTINGGFGYGASVNPSYKRRFEGQIRINF